MSSLIKTEEEVSVDRDYALKLLFKEIYNSKKEIARISEQLSSYIDIANIVATHDEWLIYDRDWE